MNSSFPTESMINERKELVEHKLNEAIAKIDAYACHDSYVKAYRYQGDFPKSTKECQSVASIPLTLREVFNFSEKNPKYTATTSDRHTWITMKPK
jgi:hypothetical protein